MKYSIITYCLRLWLITEVLSYWLCIAILLLFREPIKTSFLAITDGFITSMEYSLGFFAFTMLLVRIIKELGISVAAKKAILIIMGSPLYLSIDVYRGLFGKIKYVPPGLFLFSIGIYTIVFATTVIYFKLPSARSLDSERGIIIPFRSTKNARPI